MKREIKYKFFIENESRMIDAVGFCYESDTQIRIWYRKDDILSSESFNTIWVKPMQYIGVKDKNGTEIYTGHIVTAVSQGSKANFEVHFRNGGSPSYILYPAWQNREFWHIHATEHKKGKQFIDVECKITTTDREGFYDDGLEVIGNIYEHPSLLNQQ